MRIAAIGLFAAVLATGCLGSTYVVPKDDLQRLAVTDPATRSQRVRVVQEFVTAAEPPPGPRVSVHTGLYIAVGASHARRVDRGSSGGSGGGTSGRGGRGGQVGGADASAESAAVLVLVAAGAAIGLAATEGARYDGWAALHPMHPLHLRMHDGSWVWVPIQNLTPDLAANAEEAIVRETEGPWTPVGRAPLDRVGFTYALELGGAQLDSVAGSRPWGFAGRIQIGGFPLQQLGILGSATVAWARNADAETVFNSRYALELHAYPLTAGPLSAGAYLQAGYGYTAEDTAPFGETQTRWNPLYGGGVLVQLDLTTRLALTVRGGVTRLVADEGTHDLGEASVGLAIY
jgi:hypothetical protein